MAEVGDELPEDTIYLQRNEDGAWTNLPVIAVDKSLTGYEWGYSGAGPADLAMNILEWALQKRGHRGRRVHVLQGRVFLEAYMMHQDYKTQVIAKLPWEGGVIKLADVWNWIDHQDIPDLSSLNDDDPEF